MIRSVPELDPQVCVRSMVRGASCASCALACPAAALAPTANGIELEPDLCTGCGQCQGICPTGAFGAADVPPIEAGLMVLSCSHASGGATVGCAHAVGISNLAGLWEAGLRDIAVATAECAACADAPERSLSDDVRQLNAVLQARDLPPIRLRRATRDERRPTRVPQNAARRDIFAKALPPRDHGALARVQGLGPGLVAHAPVIDPAICTACNACVRVCPEGVLMLIKDADGGLRYDTDAGRCTGCALCEDVCDDHAIRLDHDTRPPGPVSLRGFRCKICGVQSYAMAGGDDDTCHICRKRPHASGLYQVID